MKLPGYYSSGQFARMANVSVRTIRFYDKQNILKPSYVTPAGARFYTELIFVADCLREQEKVSRR
jgi:DNA-binding transcriptional MerR regulator